MQVHFYAGSRRRVLSALSCFLGALSLFTGRSVPAQTNVVMRHNNLSRTGQYLNETTLNTSNVIPSKFGRLFSLTTDGDAYAQPLYVANLAIPGKGTHNVLFIATCNNTVYAYDADDANGVLLWSVNLGPSVPGNVINSQNMVFGPAGIMSTPAIDATTKTIYVTTKDYFSGAIAFHLHALDITTGAEKLGGPIAISAQVNGTGDGNDGAGHVPFNPAKENQRSAVTLANGNVYLVFASHEDFSPYHGWVLSYNATTLAQNGVHCTTPNGGLGGIWMSGEGVAVDSGGNLYYNGGNGTYDGTTNFGESVVKLGSNTARKDWFTPSNYDYLNSIDFDLGTSGVMIMPTTGYLIAGSKAGEMYVIDPNNMTHFHSGGDRIIQEWQASPGHIHSSFTIWDSPVNGTTLYVWGERDYLKAFKYSGGAFQTTPFSQSAMQVYPGYTNGPAVALSANGTTNGTGIVWATLPLDVDTLNAYAHGVVRAFDASDLTHEVWDSLMNAGDDVGYWAKYTPPIIVNGKVYVASFNNKLHVYGILPATAPPAPTNPAAIATDSLVALSWDNMPRTASYSVLRSVTAGGPYSTLATGLVAHSYNDNAVTNGTTYYYRVVSVNAYGAAQSAEVSAKPTAPVTGNGEGLLGTYYTGNSADWSPETGTPFLQRIDQTINFNVDNGGVANNPASWPSGVPHDNYTAVWTGKFLAPYTGAFLFQTNADDGARLTFNGNLLFNDPTYHGPLANTSAPVNLVAGQKYDIKAEFFQGGGGATMQLLYALQGTPFAIIPQSQLFSNVTAPPQNAPVLTALAGNGAVGLTWTTAQFAFTYTVSRAASAGGPFTVIATGVNAQNYRDTGLTNGVTYYYTVVGVNSVGTGPTSNAASATPTNLVHPIAWWQFESGTIGSHIAAAPAQIADLSGNGNTLQTASDGAAPTVSADDSGATSNPFSANTVSLDFSQAPVGSSTRNVFTGAPTGDINTHVLNQFTLEASVKFFSLGGFQTFVGKDGYQVAGDGNGSDSCLYFQSPDPGNTGGVSVVSIRTHQANGTFIIVNGTTPLVANQWYNVVTTMDGATLKLYLQTTPGGAYNLEGSAPFVGPMANQNTAWSVGRGFYGNGATDQLRGLVDEVRISDVALDPSQFLYAPAQPISGRIALEGVSDLSAISPAAPTGAFAFQFRTPGTLNTVFSATANITPLGAGSPYGTYAIPGVPAGTYDVAIKGYNTLRVSIPNVVVNSGAVAPSVTLPAGDANGDNSVDVGDFGLLVNAYGGLAGAPGSGYDARADFNYDGSIDVGDFGLFVNEYDALGAP